VRWGYTFEPDSERFGAQADAEIVKRHDAAKCGIPATLASIKKAAEAP
jgi:hypothetical protein